MTTNQLKQLSELQLLRLYKQNKDDVRLRDKIYGIFYEKYYLFLKSEGNRLFSKIDSNYFSMDICDCENQANYCLKLAMDWFDQSKFKGNANLFSIAHYVKLQMDAKISSFYWKRIKKIKKNVDQTYCSDLSFYADEREETETKVINSELDSRLDDQQKKLKSYLMEGVKEYKIKNILGVNNKEYFSLKEKLKQTMISLGYN